MVKFVTIMTHIIAILSIICDKLSKWQKYQAKMIKVLVWYLFCSIIVMNKILN